MIELRFYPKNAEGGEELLSCVLSQAGVKDQRRAEQRWRGKHYFSVYCDGNGQADSIVGSVLRIARVRITRSVIRDADWKTRWKKYFRPFMIVPGIRIVPVWSTNRPPVSPGNSILIDTTLAFGTGQHATTRMMAELMYRFRARLNRFCDIGTGTGILSLVARRCGARTIWALDCDAHAVATARANFRMNSLRCRLKKSDIASFRAEPFDFVAANLLTEVLVASRATLVSLTAPHGMLAVSGIHADNYRSFRKRFDGTELRCMKALKRRNWHAVLYKKV